MAHDSVNVRWNTGLKCVIAFKTNNRQTGISQTDATALGKERMALYEVEMLPLTPVGCPSRWEQSIQRSRLLGLGRILPYRATRHRMLAGFSLAMVDREIHNGRRVQREGRMPEGGRRKNYELCNW